jgi:hypothetical protein
MLKKKTIAALMFVIQSVSLSANAGLITEHWS